MNSRDESPPRLIFLRHGRTTANATGLLLGRTNPPLDETGQAQARSVAELLGSAALGKLRAVVSSPLLRTRQTAEMIGLPFEVDDRLIEVDYGQLDGTPIAEVSTEMWTRWREDPTFRPPGGESLLEVGERVRAACEDLAETARQIGTIVVVSHVSPIKAAVAWALGVDDRSAWRSHLDTASMSIIDVSGTRPLLRGFNIVADLKGRS